MCTNIQRIGENETITSQDTEGIVHWSYETVRNCWHPEQNLYLRSYNTKKNSKLPLHLCESVCQRNYHCTNLRTTPFSAKINAVLGLAARISCCMCLRSGCFCSVVKPVKTTLLTTPKTETHIRNHITNILSKTTYSALITGAIPLRCWG